MAALGKYSADQQAAMAMGGIFLSANQSYAETFQAGLKPLNGRQEGASSRKRL